MLRSLVGSEMCIRDRFRSCLAAYSRGPAERRRRDRGAERRGNSRREWGCLLYTSDAADDLLCVDLGGGRIIQKKTTTRQSL